MDIAMCESVTGSQRFHITKNTLGGVWLAKYFSAVSIYLTRKLHPHMLQIGVLQEVARCSCQRENCLDPSRLGRETGLVWTFSAQTCAKLSQKTAILNNSLVLELQWQRNLRLFWASDSRKRGAHCPRPQLQSFHYVRFTKVQAKLSDKDCSPSECWSHCWKIHTTVLNLGHWNIALGVEAPWKNRLGSDKYSMGMNASIFTYLQFTVYLLEAKT